MGGRGILSQCPQRHVPFLCLDLVVGEGAKIGESFTKCEEVLRIDVTEGGWRLKGNHMKKGLRGPWRWGMVGVGVREGTRLA